MKKKLEYISNQWRLGALQVHVSALKSMAVDKSLSESWT